MARVAVIPGDGIGQEVIPWAVKVLEQGAAMAGRSLSIRTFDFGAARYLKDGVGLPDRFIPQVQDQFDAVLLGAIGDPRIPDNAHGREIVLGLRFGLDLFLNLRPVRLLHPDLSPLKSLPPRFQLTLLRENTEGAYVGIGGQFKTHAEDEVAIQSAIHTRKGITRAQRWAFERAHQTKQRLCLVDKRNALEYGHGLWARIFEEERQRHPQVQASHLLADAAAMALLLRPCDFDLLLCPNLIGDILSDQAAALVGGLGVAPSANLNPNGPGLFEPVHGSAPDLVGRGIANPIAAILSAGLLLEDLGEPSIRQAIEAAVETTLAQGVCPVDLGGRATTQDVGESILRTLRTLG